MTPNYLLLFAHLDLHVYFTLFPKILLSYVSSNSITMNTSPLVLFQNVEFPDVSRNTDPWVYLHND